MTNEHVTKIDTWKRVEQEIEYAKSRGATPYVMVMRKVDGWRRRHEAYSLDGKLLTTAAPTYGPGGVSHKLNRRKGKYYSVVNGLYTFDDAERFSIDVLKKKVKDSDAEIQAYLDEQDRLERDNKSF